MEIFKKLNFFFTKIANRHIIIMNCDYSEKYDFIAILEDLLVYLQPQTYEKINFDSIYWVIKSFSIKVFCYFISFLSYPIIIISKEKDQTI